MKINYVRPIELASSNQDGLMSKEDKSKLNTMESGANITPEIVLTTPPFVPRGTQFIPSSIRIGFSHTVGHTVPATGISQLVGYCSTLGGQQITSIKNNAPFSFALTSPFISSTDNTMGAAISGLMISNNFSLIKTVFDCEVRTCTNDDNGNYTSRTGHGLNDVFTHVLFSGRSNIYIGVTDDKVYTMPLSGGNWTLRYNGPRVSKLSVAFLKGEDLSEWLVILRSDGVYASPKSNFTNFTKKINTPFNEKFVLILGRESPPEDDGTSRYKPCEPTIYEKGSKKSYKISVSGAGVWSLYPLTNLSSNMEAISLYSDFSLRKVYLEGDNLPPPSIGEFYGYRVKTAENTEIIANSTIYRYKLEDKNWSPEYYLPESWKSAISYINLNSVGNPSAVDVYIYGSHVQDITTDVTFKMIYSAGYNYLTIKT